MLTEKIRKLADKDELLFHKVGLIFGAISGIFLGLIVSDKADEFELQEVQREAINGEETN